MPFPLNFLPYGLRRRLRELVSPTEANALQTAAPDFKYFHPIQKCERLIDVELSMKKHVLTITELASTTNYAYELKLVDNSYYCDRQMYISSFRLTDSPRLILDSFRLAPRTLTFYKCNINASFFKQLATRMERPLEYLKLTECRIQSETVDTYVCKAFKSLTEFHLSNCAAPSIENASSFPTWIDAFLQMNCTTLKTIYLDSSSVFASNIKAEKFVNFVKAQRNLKLFTFILNKSPIEQVEKKIITLFNEKHFERLSTLPSPKEKVVQVMFADKRYFYRVRKQLYDDKIGEE